MIAIYLQFSPLLQQLEGSEYRAQHHARILDDFAASTLLQNFQPCRFFLQPVGRSEIVPSHPDRDATRRHPGSWQTVPAH